MASTLNCSDVQPDVPGSLDTIIPVTPPSIPPSRPPSRGCHPQNPDSLPSENGSMDQVAQRLGHSHYSTRTPWLRALVLGANDGLVSISALLMGVGAGSEDQHTLLLSGVAGLVGGALSMACGEYISVASQKDAEQADIAKEMEEQRKGPLAQVRLFGTRGTVGASNYGQAAELEELAGIYMERGLPMDLAHRVAEVLTERDVIRAHARDELGIDLDQLANPLQASVVSAICFSCGAGMPLLAAAFILDWRTRLAVVAAVSTLGLAVFGCLGAYLGGANMLKGGARVVVGGWLAMALTYAVGMLFGSSAAA